MAETTVVLSEYGELLALHKTIMEAKFAVAPEHREICGSPLVCSVAERVVDALRELDLRTHGDGRAREWDTWREVSPDRREWRIALSRIDPRDSAWRAWGAAEKRRFARLLLSPLRATEEQLEQFVSQVER